MSVALVTGAGSGIGRATAAALAAAGHHIVVWDRDAAGAAETVSRIASGEALALDITDLAALRAAAAALVQKHGAPDIVVTNAGLSGDSLPFAEIGEAEFDAMFAVNVRAHFFLLQALVPAMRKKGGGAIVMVSSMFALVGWMNMAHYSAAKGGVLALAKSLARELGPDNIRVNAVAPGLIRTPMTERSQAANPRAFTERAAGTPLRRLTTVEEVAATIAYLASPAASSLTGQCLSPSSGEVFTD
jgi:NAD(P)-dependent dehydrogenase (short-subunit alcohol dehydrogenase family)